MCNPTFCEFHQEDISVCGCYSSLYQKTEKVDGGIVEEGAYLVGSRCCDAADLLPRCPDCGCLEYRHFVAPDGWTVCNNCTCVRKPERAKEHAYVNPPADFTHDPRYRIVKESIAHYLGRLDPAGVRLADALKHIAGGLHKRDYGIADTCQYLPATHLYWLERTALAKQAGAARRKAHGMHSVTHQSSPQTAP